MQHSVEHAWRVYDDKDVQGLNAFLSIDREAAVEEAVVAGGEAANGPLAGVPIAIKDNIATLKLPTTCASRILEGYVSPFEATAVRRLREAGAVIVGKTNMDEFAMGSSSENSAFGPVLNPLDRTRVPGGSSGGSAAAVASGMLRVALGSETGGSVRQPAAFCGIVGIKPSYGRVSRYGLVAYASSLDNIGVFGATVAEAATVLQVISGHDRFDATSSLRAVPSFAAAQVHASGGHGHAVSSVPLSPVLGSKPLQGVVIGRPREYFPDTLDRHIAEHCDRALNELRELGASVRDVSLPGTELAVPVYYIIAPAEASSNLSRFDGVRFGVRRYGGSDNASNNASISTSGLEHTALPDLRGMYEQTRSRGFGPEVIRRILLGTYVLSAGYYDAYYLRAQAVRKLIRQEFEDVFASGVHMLFTPTTPTSAFRLGQHSDPYQMYLSDIFTVTANLVGIPAMSQPIGLVDGLPVGGQLMAPHFQEASMIRVASWLEKSLIARSVISGGHS